MKKKKNQFHSIANKFNTVNKMILTELYISYTRSLVFIQLDLRIDGITTIKPRLRLPLFSKKKNAYENDAHSYQIRIVHG